MSEPRSYLSLWDKKWKELISIDNINEKYCNTD